MPDSPVERTVEAHFEITDFDESLYEEPDDGPKLSSITIRKRYQGVIEGTGVTRVLTARGTGGGGYVASERIEGTLDGREGTFVIQHHGVAEGEEQRSDGHVIPTSGTGGLSGISGRAMEKEFQVLTLVYTL